MQKNVVHSQTGQHLEPNINDTCVRAHTHTLSTEEYSKISTCCSHMRYFPASVSLNYRGPYESDTFQTFPQLPFSAVPSEMTNRGRTVFQNQYLASSIVICGSMKIRHLKYGNVSEWLLCKQRM